MKTKTLVGIGVVAAGVTAGLVYGALLLRERKKAGKGSASGLWLFPPGKGPSLYVCKKTGDPMFFSGDLIKRAGGKLYFEAPCHPNSVEYVADLSGPGGQVGVIAPSDKEILGHVIEREDGKLRYVMKEELFRKVPFDGRMNKESLAQS